MSAAPVITGVAYPGVEEVGSLNKTRLVVGLCAVTAGLVVAGCGKSGTGTSAGAPSPSPSLLAPADALTVSIKPLSATSFEFTVKSGAALSANGKADPAKKNMSISLSGQEQGTSLKVDAVQIGDQLWMKYDLGADTNKQFDINPSKWMLIDTTKVKDKTNMPSAEDVTGLAADLANATSVTRTDATHLVGTVDLTQANGMIAAGGDTSGDKAKAVPFTATLDDKGRLIELKTNGTDKSLDVDLTVTNYGATETFSKPSGAVSAPPKLYDMLNG